MAFDSATLRPETRNATISLVAGVAYTVLVVGAMHVSLGGFDPRALPSTIDFTFVLFLTWVLGGLVILGAVATFVFLKWRLVTPAVVVVGLFVRALVPHLDRYIDIPHLLTGYLLAWFVVLAAALVVGAVELGLKRAIRRRRTAGANPRE